MLMSRCILCCALALAIWTDNCAVAATYGPFADLKETIDVPQGDGIVISFSFPTEHKVSGPVSNPPPNVGDTVKDKITYSIEIPINFSFFANVGGIAWHSTEEPDNGSRVITTLYGVDLDPNGTSMHLTGFDAVQAAQLSFHDETIIGASGTLYSGVSLGTPTLADLPALLPGFDLSAIDGDPSSVVYVFQTTVPHFDIAPEPASWLSAGIGVAIFAWASLRRRQAASV
jgi:hypothetical protein